jgi:hypothetical protein
MKTHPINYTHARAELILVVLDKLPCASNEVYLNTLHMGTICAKAHDMGIDTRAFFDQHIEEILEIGSVASQQPLTTGGTR